MCVCTCTHLNMLHSLCDLISKVTDQVCHLPKTTDLHVTELDAAVGPTSLLVTVVPNNQNTKYTGVSTGARPLPPDQLKCNILKGTHLFIVILGALCFSTHQSKTCSNCEQVIYKQHCCAVVKGWPLVSETSIH